MHVDLISATRSRSKEIHATVNGKHTACRINLSKPENIGQYTSIGEMKDVVEITCEKCKNVIAKQLIRESNKEMKQFLKAEQKQLKQDDMEMRKNGTMPSREASPIAAPPAYKPQSSDGEYIPPSMRRQQDNQPIVSPTPPVSAPVSAPANDFEIPVVPTAPQIPRPAQSSNDVLSQFAVPSAPQASQPLDNVEDVLSQFNVPTTPQIPRPAQSSNDVLPQFAVPSAPQVQQPLQNVDDVLSQFTVPTTPQIPRPAQSSNDVLSQFAVPSAPQASQPLDNVEDVLSQFNVPTAPQMAGSVPSISEPEVPTLEPYMPSNGAPTLADPEDILAQFSVPTQPSNVPPVQQSVPAAGQASTFDNLANSLFDPIAPMDEIPSVPTAPQSAAFNAQLAEPEKEIPTLEPVGQSPMLDDMDDMGGFSAILPDEEEIIEVLPESLTENFDPFETPSAGVPSLDDSLDDFLVMPSSAGAAPTAPTAPSVPNLSNVASAPEEDAFASLDDVFPDLNTVPTAPTAGLPDFPELTNLTEAPSMPIPEQPVPPQMQQPQQPLPQYNMQGAADALNEEDVPTPQIRKPENNLFAVPKARKQRKPGTPPPLFVGYSAEGRRVFQEYDEFGRPLPITEPVYSTPPQESENPFVQAAKGVGAAAGLPQGGTPVLDVDELMEAMGIEDPNKKKKQTVSDKPVNFTEYKMPQKTAKKQMASVPSSAQSAPKQEGPVSVAEAKRRKKLDKINKEFEKQLRTRGLDPQTGAYVGKQKK